MNKEWSEKNRKMQSLIGKKESFDPLHFRPAKGHPGKCDVHILPPESGKEAGQLGGHPFFLRQSGFPVPGADGEIDLELGLRAGGTHHGRAVPGKQEFEHIRPGEAVQTQGIVEGIFHALPADLFDPFPEGAHDALHLFKPGRALEGVAVQGVQAVAVFSVQL